MSLITSILSFGPFRFSISSDIDLLNENLKKIYTDSFQTQDNEFIDFHISLVASKGIRRFYKPQVNFYFEEHQPFKPLPLDQAYAMLEWAMNWCIATNAHQYLILHSAVIEKDNKAIIMPAPPGSGKSTLCASLVFNGWRLFSDELGLIHLIDKKAYPIARAINLKNNTIDIIKQHINDAIFSSTALDTHKGTVALLKPPKESVLKDLIPAVPHAIVFPKYEAGAKETLTPIDALDAFPLMIENSFNYNVLAEEGFKTMSDLLEFAPCYALTYSDFTKANTLLNELLEASH